MMEKKVRLRYAPSPTGAQHLGGIRTALYNYLFVRQQGGDFILRIEDTDMARYVPGAEEYVIESCKWAGIEFDEGVHVGGPYAPYRQSERKELYKRFADQLIADGHAYYAFDTAEELEEMRNRIQSQGNPSPAYDHITRQYMKNSTSLSHDEVQRRLDSNEPHVVRIKMPRNEEIKFQDLIRGWVSFDSSQLDDKVLFKSDGMPTYHLANVVDDYLMKITHVVRGEEWLPSAPTHVMLYKMLGWENEMPHFAHLPLILKPEGNGKLSKRDGDKYGFPLYSIDWKEQQISGLREKGFLPEAYINFLAFLGWNPGTDQEIFSREELITAFSFERIGKSGARFDPEKAKWFNQQHIRRKSGEELAALLQPWLDKQGVEASPEFVIRVCDAMKERAVFIPDLYEMGRFFFEEISAYDESTIRKKWKPEVKDFFLLLISNIKATDHLDAHNMEVQIKELMKEKNLGMGDVMPMLRVALSGGLQGPPVFTMMEVLGKKNSLNRLEKSIEIFDNFQ